MGVSQFIIPEKTKIEGHEISTIDPIPFGHKVCLKTIKKGDPIIKYDQIIGFALDDKTHILIDPDESLGVDVTVILGKDIYSIPELSSLIPTRP